MAASSSSAPVASSPAAARATSTRTGALTALILETSRGGAKRVTGINTLAFLVCVAYM